MLLLQTLQLKGKILPFKNFPSKKWVGNLNPEFLQGRRRDLEEFAKVCALGTSRCRALCASSTSWLCFGSVQSHAAGSPSEARESVQHAVANTPPPPPLFLSNTARPSRNWSTW